MQKLENCTTMCLKMSYGESYIYGTAVFGEREYKINIQSGSKGVLLPNEFEPVSEVLIDFLTEKGSRLTLRSKASMGKDWIEIYDDKLTEKLMKDLPVEMTIVVIEK